MNETKDRRDYGKCEEAGDGKHEPDFESVVPADEVGEEGIMDVCCKHCGQSGSFRVTVQMVAWE